MVGLEHQDGMNLEVRRGHLAEPFPGQCLHSATGRRENIEPSAVRLYQQVPNEDAGAS